MTQETAKERTYREALEILRGMGINSKNRVMMPYGVAVTAQEFIEEKLEDAENMPSTTDKLSVEKLEPIGYYNEAHGFLHDEFDKDCYCQGGCSMEAVYTESQVKKLTDEKTVEKLQEQLNSKDKALTEIRANIEEHNQIYDLDVNTALLLEGIDGIAFDALAAIGGDDE